jgi:transcriptional regulator with XRE-family HTH domain
MFFIILCYMKSVKPFPQKKLRELIRASGLADQDFAASIGLSPAHLSNILRGARKPSREVLERLSEVYGINPGELLGVSASAETVYVELLQQEAAAGRGIEVEDYAESTYLAVPQSLISPHRPDSIKALLVRGESMIDEKIYDGDYVLYNRQEREDALIPWDYSHIFVVSVGSSLLVKRVVIDPPKKEIRLISANKAAGDSYADRVFHGPECEEVRIAGKVIACMHRMA